MSNTSSVTPYVEADRVGGAISASIAECAAATVRWLTEETETDLKASAELAGERRRERLSACSERQCVNSPGARVNTAQLHLRNPESLVRTAEQLGYRLETPAPSTSQSQPDRNAILLRNSAGERLAIESTREGRVAMHTAGSIARIYEVVRQNQIDTTLDHFRARGLNVASGVDRAGNVQIVAREQNTSKVDGEALVKAQVGPDGGIWVDVDCVHGRRCETIVADLASAVGGEVVGTRRKREAVRLPAAKPRKHVRS